MQLPHALLGFGFAFDGGAVRGQTCSKREEADLVLILPQQRHDPLSHALVPLVDELLAEVAVNLLGCHLLMRWEGGVEKVGQLQRQDRGCLQSLRGRSTWAGLVIYLSWADGASWCFWGGCVSHPSPKSLGSALLLLFYE